LVLHHVPDVAHAVPLPGRSERVGEHHVGAQPSRAADLEDLTGARRTTGESPRSSPAPLLPQVAGHR
jgi:hypothetical protein